MKVYTQTRRYVRTTAFASGLVFSDSYSDAALCMSMRSQAQSQSGSLIEVLDALESLDDVQNIFTNANL